MTWVGYRGKIVTWAIVLLKVEESCLVIAVSPKAARVSHRETKSSQAHVSSDLILTCLTQPPGFYLWFPPC